MRKTVLELRHKKRTFECHRKKKRTYVTGPRVHGLVIFHRSSICYACGIRQNHPPPPSPSQNTDQRTTDFKYLTSKDQELSRDIEIKIRKIERLQSSLQHWRTKVGSMAHKLPLFFVVSLEKAALFV